MVFALCVLVGVIFSAVIVYVQVRVDVAVLVCMHNIVVSMLVGVDMLMLVGVLQLDCILNHKNRADLNAVKLLEVRLGILTATPFTFGMIITPNARQQEFV